MGIRVIDGDKVNLIIRLKIDSMGEGWVRGCPSYARLD